MVIHFCPRQATETNYLSPGTPTRDGYATESLTHASQLEFSFYSISSKSSFFLQSYPSAFSGGLFPPEDQFSSSLFWGIRCSILYLSISHERNHSVLVSCPLTNFTVHDTLQISQPSSKLHSFYRSGTSINNSKDSGR